MYDVKLKIIPQKVLIKDEAGEINTFSSQQRSSMTTGQFQLHLAFSASGDIKARLSLFARLHNRVY